MKSSKAIKERWNRREKEARDNSKQSIGWNTSAKINWGGFPLHITYAETVDGEIIRAEVSNEGMVKVFDNRVGRYFYMTTEDFRKEQKKLEMGWSLKKINRLPGANPFWKS